MAAHFDTKTDTTRVTALVLIAIIGGERVAIAASAIESVVDLWQIVPVPLAADHIIGLAAVRSTVLTVVDAAAAVGLRAKATGNRAIVVAAAGHRYALRVDAIVEVVAPHGSVASFEPGVGDKWQAVAIGAVDTAHGFAVLIDPVRLVTGPVALAA